MKKVFLLLFGVLIVFVAVFVKSKQGLTLQVGNAEVKVEVARNEKERELGLSHKKSLCQECGMMFVFEKPGLYPFWMKEMYFDIDIMWITDDRVADITFEAKKPSLEEFDNPKTIYTPKVPVDKVLEVNAGWVEKNKIKVGDLVK